MSLVVMQLVLQSEEPRRAALCSTRGELYRASKIHAMVLPQVEQVVYQGRGGLLSPVSQQQSLLRCRSIVVVQRCCQGSGSALCHVDAPCPVRGAQILSLP